MRTSGAESHSTADCLVFMCTSPRHKDLLRYFRAPAPHAQQQRESLQGRPQSPCPPLGNVRSRHDIEFVAQMRHLRAIRRLGGKPDFTKNFYRAPRHSRQLERAPGDVGGGVRSISSRMPSWTWWLPSMADRDKVIARHRDPEVGAIPLVELDKSRFSCSRRPGSILAAMVLIGPKPLTKSSQTDSPSGIRNVVVPVSNRSLNASPSNS